MRKIVLQHNRHQADLPSPHDHVRSARDSVAKLRCALRAGWLVSFWSSACAAFPLRELGHSECVCRFRMCILTQTIFTMVAEWMMLAGRRARLVRGDPTGRSAYRERDFGFMPKHSSKIATDALAAWMQRCHPFFARCRFGAKARLSRLWTETDSGCSMFPVRSRERTVRNHFKHSVELVDREGEIADVLAAVEDFLLARATYEAARQQWPKEHIRLRQETRIVEDGSDPH